MEVSQALRRASEAAGWSPAKVAAEAGVAETSVRKWLSGETRPRFDPYQRLRQRLPGFADLVDGKAVA